MKRVFSGKTPHVSGWNRFHVRQFIEEVCEAFTRQLSLQRVNVHIDIPAEAAVLADRQLLRQAVVNLIDNALEAMPGGGELVITGVTVQGGLELEIADSGDGLADNVQQRVFEPYFTTRAEAAGLGLTLVQRVAALHGGSVTALNCPEGGAAFTLHIPNRVLVAAA